MDVCRCRGVCVCVCGIRCYLCLSFVFKLFARFPLTNGFSLVAQPDERSHHKNALKEKQY